MTNDIAIVGMSGLFPGAGDIHTYWQNILNKVDNVQDAPEEWASPYFDPNAAQSRLDSARIYTRKVGLLGDFAQFNPLEFGVPPKAVEGDPSHFLALKLARDALKDANYLERHFNREKTGIILGRGSNPNRGDVTGMQYGLVIDQTMDLLGQLIPQLCPEMRENIRQELRASLPAMEIEQAPSLVSNVVTGRIANRLDLMGPNYLIDAACSSSLIAIDLAIKELLKDRCDMMLAGGLQASMPPQIYMLFCQLNALSPTKIRPFDKLANGTLLSEGVGFLVLKRLADAQRDGDRIYAVIKGVGVASDGKALGLLAPRLDGEILALKRAYEQTGIDPDTVGLIEAHGTGIPLGDRTEIQALSAIFGKRQGKIPRCAIGSIKSMIGHCIPAAGVASLVKMALSLYYKTLPPTLCDEVNPNLDLEKTPFYINTEARPWIHRGDYPRRAGINAFGFGGINTHAILEEYQEPSRNQTIRVSIQPEGQQRNQNSEGADSLKKTTTVWHKWPTELVFFSSNERPALFDEINKVQQFLQGNPQTSLANLAYTQSLLNVGNFRLAIIAKNIPDLQQKLALVVEKLADSTKTKLASRSGIYYAENQVPGGKTAFMFSTEGSQYPNMLADLCLYFPQVRVWFDFLDETFPRKHPPSQFIFPPPTGLTDEEREWTTAQLFAGDLATETVSTASLAIYELLHDLEIKCDVMIGHSAGEHVAVRAACIAHFTSPSHLKEQLRRLNQIYSQFETNNTITKGRLLSVGGLGYDAIAQLINTFSGSVYLVSDNCPSQVLLFTTENVSDAVTQQIQSAGGIWANIPFDRAYHTPLFESGVEALRSYYDGIELGTSNVQVYSCATTEPYPLDANAIRHISAEQWSKPVRFRETIERLHQDGVRIFIEVGASNNLTAFVDNILKGKNYLAIPTNTQKQAGLEQLQHLLGKLFVNGISWNMAPLYQHRPVSPVNLEESVSVGQKPSPILNLLLPRMTLRSEFVAQIQEKLLPLVKEESFISTVAEPERNPPTTLTLNSPDARPENHRSGLSGARDRAISRDVTDNVSTLNSNSETATDKTLTTENQKIEPEIEHEFTQTSIADEDIELAILSSHFELMQEFLANQARVAEAFFSPHAATENENDVEHKFLPDSDG